MMHKRKRVYIDKLYASRKEGRGLTRTDDCVDATIQGLEEYTKESKERMITAANNSKGNITTSDKTTKSRRKNRRKTTG